jgi:hypothetical protein
MKPERGWHGMPKRACHQFIADIASAQAVANLEDVKSFHENALNSVEGCDS